MWRTKNLSSKGSGVVLVFSKGTEVETVKTRLAPALTPPQRLAFHLSLLQDAIDKATDTGFPVCVYIAGNQKLPFDPGIPLISQTGNDLGERMMNAFEENLSRYERVVIIGTDSPTLTPERILQTFAHLTEHEVVIGPTEDGGYYLIGLSRFIREIFQEIPWGTNRVLEETRRRLNLRQVLLLAPDFDVDRPEDLVRLQQLLKKNPSLAPHTAATLASIRL